VFSTLLSGSLEGGNGWAKSMKNNNDKKFKRKRETTQVNTTPHILTTHTLECRLERYYPSY
jgi:hypothetical protein